MNLLHISDMHFGTRHWTGDNQKLLDEINSYAADLVINTGDNTTDALENEYIAAGQFLSSINCKNIISIPGNHDKRNMLSQDFFRMYIDDVDVIFPSNPEKCKKSKMFLDDYTQGIKEKCTDINFIKKLTIDGQSLLVVCLDTNVVYKDIGYVDKQILDAVSNKIKDYSYDQIILLNHHSILDTDYDPLFNSGRVIDFVKKHDIKHVFCGHTHKLELSQFTDIYNGHSFFQYKNGSLTSFNTPNDSNMFLFFENFAEENMKIHIIRVYHNDGKLSFKKEIISNKKGINL